jgi:hypothetical protein
MTQAAARLQQQQQQLQRLAIRLRLTFAAVSRRGRGQRAPPGGAHATGAIGSGCCSLPVKVPLISTSVQSMLVLWAVAGFQAPARAQTNSSNDGCISISADPQSVDQ